MTSTVEVRGGIELPARREDIEMTTVDGLTLVGELAMPLESDPVATLVTFHPLPTAGGFMDSHVLRKAAARLPALADLAVTCHQRHPTVRLRLLGINSAHVARSIARGYGGSNDWS